MSDLPAEVYPERVELEVVDADPPVRIFAAMAAMSDRGLSLLVDDGAAVEAFPPGTLVKGSYGDHTGLCQFESSVIEASPPVAADGAPARPGVIRLQPPPRIVTIQRRRFARADVDMTIPVSLLNTTSMAWQAAPGEVHSLGGGGLMMIIAPHPSLKVGARLALALTVPGGDTVVTLARVVQVLAPDEEDGPATVRVGFLGLEATEADRLERFVYRKLGGVAAAKLWSAGKIGRSAG